MGVVLTTTACGDKNQALYDEYHSIMCKSNAFITDKIPMDIPEMTRLTARGGQLNAEFIKIQQSGNAQEHLAKLAEAMNTATCK